MQQLHELLNGPAILASAGVAKHRRNAIAECLSDRWFGGVGCASPACAEGGTRPGDVRSDLLCNFCMREVLAVVQNEMASRAAVHACPCCLRAYAGSSSA